MKKMKKKVKCARQFTYMAREMKKLKGVYSFTQHTKPVPCKTVLVLCTHFTCSKRQKTFLDAIKMSLILPYF